MSKEFKKRVTFFNRTALVTSEKYILPRLYTGSARVKPKIEGNKREENGSFHGKNKQ